MVGVLIDKLDTCWYSGRRMKTEGYWVEMACPTADLLLALHSYPVVMYALVCYGIVWYGMDGYASVFVMKWYALVWFVMKWWALVWMSMVRLALRLMCQRQSRKLASIRT